MSQTFPKNLTEFIRHFLPKYKSPLIWMTISFVFAALDNALLPYVLKLFVDRATHFIGLAGFLMACILPVSLLVLFNFARIASSRIHDYTALLLYPALKADIMNESADYVSGHSFKFYQDNLSGSVSNKIGDLANNAESLILSSEILLLYSVGVISCIAISFSASPYFFALFFVWTAIFIFITLSSCKHVQPFVEEYAESRSKNFGNIVDRFANAMSVLLFAREKYEKERLKNSLKDMVNKNKSMQWEFLRFRLVMAGMIFLVEVLTIAILLYLGNKGLLTAGDFAFIILISIRLAEDVFELIGNLTRYTEQLGIFKQALTSIAIPHETKIQAGAAPLKITNGTIVFSRVHFFYSKGQQLFEDKTLVINGGEKVGLVGHSGSGKSTFVNLITRVFDPQKGEILIDGQSIHSVTLQSLRENISFIPQDPTLFHRSLMDNIRYGRLEATDEEVIEAAEKAHAHEFIIKSVDGYETLVGERGLKLSGGQRQRIAIARAILKRAPILILDEATSALDSVTESLIEESLRYAMEGKTVIVIAHRLSTVLAMDRILVFQHGRIVEEGTHEELLKSGEIYQSLWIAQTQKQVLLK